MPLKADFKNQGSCSIAKLYNFNHKQSINEAAGTQNALASEICSTLAATNLYYYMPTELRYGNLIEEINSVFTEFPTYLADTLSTLEDNLSAYLSFLSLYVRGDWHNESQQEKLAAVINRMEASNDIAILPVYNDFLLDFYLGCQEQGISLSAFLNWLTQPAQERMLENYDYWMEANSKNAEGSR